MGRLGINSENWNRHTDFKVAEVGSTNSGEGEGEQDWIVADTTAALNPKLQISAVIPTRYDKELADNRLVLEKLTRIFGVNTPDSYSAPGLLMPAVPYSGIYQSSFRQKKTAQEIRGHHKGVWDYIAAQHIRLAKGVQV
jgi:cellulose biosynthesis protein BcsQ